MSTNEETAAHFAPPDWTAPASPPLCHDCGSLPVSRLGDLCEGCKTARVAQDRRDALKAAWATVPEALRWIRSFDDVTAERWVTDIEAVVAARAAATERHIVGSGQLGAMKRPFVTLIGDAGAGKTTLAVAMLREHMRRGAVAEATFHDVLYARRARFAVAHDLIEARSRTRRGQSEAAEITIAREASVLVLDELAGSPAPDHDAVIFSIVHERHRERRPTIVTTAATRDVIASTYGGGIERRLFDDALVIDVRKVTP